METPVKGRNVVTSVHARNELVEMSDRIYRLSVVYRDELFQAAEYNGYGTPEDDEYRRELVRAAESLRDIANLTYKGKWYENDG